MVLLIATNASDICFQQTTFTGTYQGYFTQLSFGGRREERGGGGTVGLGVMLGLSDKGGKSRARGK